MTPNSPEAESNLLYCIFTAESDLRSKILEATPREYFFDFENARLYDNLKSLHDAGESVEYTTLVTQLEKSGLSPESARLSVTPIISNLTMTPFLWETYHKICQDKFTERQIENLVKDLKATNHLPTESRVSRVEEFKQKITPPTPRGSHSKKDMILEYVDQLESRQRGESSKRIIPTKFSCIDAKSGGLFRKNMGIISALPGIGKTAWGITLLVHCCVEQEFSGLLVSVEQGREEIIDRMVSSITRIPHDTLQRKSLNKGELNQVRDALLRIERSKLEIIDDPRISLEGIRETFRKVNPDIGFVDYAQKIKAPECREDGSREQQLAYISGELARVAIESDCYVLLGSQETIGQGGKVNTKHCTSITEDAHDWFRLEGIKNSQNERRIECLKRRSGSSGWNEKITFLSSIVRFENHSPLC